MGLAAVAAIWLGGKPAGSYLPKIGPAPLRFQAPGKGPDISALLPPLAMSDPAPLEEFIGPPASTNAPVAIEPLADPAPAPQEPRVTAQPSEPLLSPQMLMQFFNRDATNHNVNVLVPYQFNPPPANIPAPPSRATYNK